MASRLKKPAEAVTLRPRQVTERWNISTGTLYAQIHLYEESKGKEGLRSIHIPGRKGRRGSRLFRVQDIEAWLDRHTA